MREIWLELLENMVDLIVSLIKMSLLGLLLYILVMAIMFWGIWVYNWIVN